MRLAFLAFISPPSFPRLGFPPAIRADSPVHRSRYAPESHLSRCKLRFTNLSG